MATKKIKLNELHSIIKHIIKEEYKSNLKPDGISIGHKISRQVIDIIRNEISDEINDKLWSDRSGDVLFGFYKEIFDTLMGKIYEDYADSFDPTAGAAPDEY